MNSKSAFGRKDLLNMSYSQVSKDWRGTLVSFKNVVPLPIPKPGFIDIASQVVEIDTTGGRGVVEDIASYKCHFYVAVRQ